ncbi:MAG: glycoside hydrolase domain-containing protein [Bacteroides cellulosilyticus]
MPILTFLTGHSKLYTNSYWPNGKDLLQRVEISPPHPEAQKRMFYTGLYHTMIMPVDRSGESSLWQMTNLITMTSTPSGTLTALLLHSSP